MLSSISYRLSMLLGCSSTNTIPLLNPNEYVVSSYLNPRYTHAMNAIYKHHKIVFVNEIERILEQKCSTSADHQESANGIQCTDSVSDNCAQEYKDGGLSIQSKVDKAASVTKQRRRRSSR